MKLVNSVSVGFGLLAAAIATPLEDRAAPQTVSLTFYGGPASYSLSFPADGTVYQTNNTLSVSLIETNNYNAYGQCTFYTKGQKTLASGINSQTGAQQIFVGPPQPITSVSCIGFCIGTYGDCYNTQNQYLGPCCNGFCAATKCRPFVYPPP